MPASFRSHLSNLGYNGVICYPSFNNSSIEPCSQDRITEIRIEEILDEENNQKYYWIYYYKNEEIKIIGKSSVKPQCFRQVARYLK